MPVSNDDGGLYRAVGKIEGQLREVIHGLNNVSQKVDALGEKVAAGSNLPARVDDLDTRVTALETDKNKRDGAMGFGGWLLRSPLFGWLATAAIAVWAVLKGKAGQ